MKKRYNKNWKKISREENEKAENRCILLCGRENEQNNHLETRHVDGNNRQVSRRRCSPYIWQPPIC